MRAQHQQVGTVFIGIINQILRHFARTLIGNQQVFDGIFHTQFPGGALGGIQNLVTLCNGGCLVTLVLQKFGGERHIFGRIGNVYQSQTRTVDPGKLGGMFQGIDGRFTAVNGNNQMFVHIVFSFCTASRCPLVGWAQGQFAPFHYRPAVGLYTTAEQPDRFPV